MTNAERQKRHRERQKALREANAVTKSGGDITKTVPDTVKSVPLVTDWDKEKYPEKEAWKIAVARVERAKKYAAMFPQFVHKSDLKFQDLDWQYENEGLPGLE